MQRVGKREASANADFKVMTPSEDRQAPRTRRVQAYFDRALEASRLARTEGHRTLFEQRALLEKLFKNSDDRATARGLVAATNKVMETLMSTTDALEVEFWNHCSRLTREKLDVVDEGANTYDTLQMVHEAELAALREDLRYADEFHNQEAKRLLARWRESLEREHATHARMLLGAEGHALTVREIEAKMKSQRDEFSRECNTAIEQLNEMDSSVRRALASAQATEEANQAQICKLSEEKSALTVKVREQTLRANRYSQMLEELQELHEAAMVQVQDLQRKIEEDEQMHDSTLAAMEAEMGARMAEMHRMQAWTLASSSAKALEMREPDELARAEVLARRKLDQFGEITLGGALLGHVLSRATMAAQLSRAASTPHFAPTGASISPSIGTPRNPFGNPGGLRIPPSAQSASRMRALLYHESRQLGQRGEIWSRSVGGLLLPMATR
jgi:hypothetical protein